MTKRSFPFALFDAFSDTPFGGSQAAIVTEASGIDKRQRRRIAREIGMPATAFVNAYGEGWVDVQFMSTVMELPMCGHGTICLMTRLVEPEFMAWNCENTHHVDLHVAGSSHKVELELCDDSRVRVMLDVKPPTFSRKAFDRFALAGLLGLEDDDFSTDLPVETAHGDFVHLIVPLDGLDAMQRIRPDFRGITHYCRQHGVETIAVFSTEVRSPKNTVHVRDFCPAVGVQESAGAGTTNAALSSYLVRNGVVRPNGHNAVTVVAEQGFEINRPSSIRSVVSVDNREVSRLQVGGVATKIMDGRVYL